jgi:hypothetical protein
VRSDGYTRFHKAGRITAFQPHMHTRGRKRLTIDGSAAAHDGYPAAKQFSVFDRVSRDADTQ